MKKPNPNGANQFNLDPRQKLCWDSYINPKSKTFGNALQSAIKAGYTEETANHITKAEWFLEKTRRMNLLGKAEKVLDSTLDLHVINEEGKVDSNLLRIQTDVSKFVASTQGKNEGYSNKTEHEVNGEGLVVIGGIKMIEPNEEIEELRRQNSLLQEQNLKSKIDE